MRVQGTAWAEKEYAAVCAHCGKEYIAHNRASMYCSDECRKDARKKQNEYYRLNPEAKPRRGARPKKQKKENPFTEILVAARAAGMSYGQYVASLKQQA